MNFCCSYLLYTLPIVRFGFGYEQQHKCINKYRKIKTQLYLLIKKNMEEERTFFQTLRQFLKGNLDFDDLALSDKLIDKINKRHPKSETELIIDFGSDKKLMELLDLSEDDIWFEGVVNSPYSDYEFHSYDSGKEDFKEGYNVYNWLNEENLELLKTISKFIVPMEFDLNNGEFVSELSSKLLKIFPSETEDIIDDFVLEKNREMRQAASDSINKELEDFMSNLDIEFWQKFESIVIKVIDLYGWYARLGYLDASLEEIIEKIFATNKKHLGGWYESTWEYQNDEFFDDKSFNYYTNTKLEKIYEKIQEYAEDNEIIFSEFSEMIDRVSKKFKLMMWHDLPKNKNVQFLIDGFDISDGTISLRLMKKGTMQQVKRKLTEENFNHLLYQPSLFNFDELE